MQKNRKKKKHKKRVSFVPRLAKAVLGHVQQKDGAVLRPARQEAADEVAVLPKGQKEKVRVAGFRDLGGLGV